jgi:hypothetical protein
MKKAYIFSIILPEAKKEIKDRIRFCNENAQ